MTLIASYQREEMMVMIGDLLLSSMIPQQHHPELPSRFYGGMGLGNDHLVGLTQKLIIFDDQLAAAWAGPHIVARSILRSISEHRHSIHDASDIVSIIDNCGLSTNEIEATAFLFYFVNTNTDHIQIVGCGTSHTELGNNHKVRYAGTGAFHFFDTIEFEVKAQTGSISSFEDVIATWLSRAAIAFYQEVTTDIPHNFFYGGAFEFLVPFYMGKPLNKVPYSMFFWRYDNDGATRINIAYSLQYNETQALIINRFTEDAEGQPLMRRFIVPNLIMDCASHDLPEPVVDNFFCVHYFLSLAPQAQRVKMLVQKGEIKDLQPKLLGNLGAIGMDVSGDFVSELSAFLMP